jgi:hypothetical protein
MEAKETVKSVTYLKMKPFKHIRIGDPLYFENMEDDPKRYKKLVADVKPTCCKFGAIRIRDVEVEDEYEGMPLKYNQIVVDVFMAPTEEKLQVYLNDRYFGENSVKQHYELGCDTASYEICVDGRYDEVHTGADGYYGTLSHMKQYFGFMMTLFFDGSLFDMEDVEKKLRYWFEVIEKK